MSDWLPKDFWTRNETLVAAVIAVFCIVATLSDPRFFTITTVSDLLRASITIGILAVGAKRVAARARPTTGPPTCCWRCWAA
jgi:simple sugar transport system permease protein